MRLGQVMSGNTAIEFGDDAKPMLELTKHLEPLGFQVLRVIDGLDLIECRLLRQGTEYSLSWDIWTGLVLFPYAAEGNALILVVFEHLRSLGW